MIEHFTTHERPDPEFMRLHAMSLASAIESWSIDMDERRQEEADDAYPSPHLKG